MLAVFTLKDAMPDRVAQKETERADALFQGFEIEIFHHADNVKWLHFVGIIGAVYIFFPMGSAYPKNCAVVSLMTMAVESPP